MQNDIAPALILLRSLLCKPNYHTLNRELELPKVQLFKRRKGAILLILFRKFKLRMELLQTNQLFIKHVSGGYYI
jgi:hypothetical protein